MNTIISQINCLILLILFLMLLEKGMIYQLLYIPPVIRVLLKTSIQKISNFCTHKEIGRNFDLILHNFNQLLFPCDFKRILANYHFVHHDANRPNIYFFIIFTTFQYLRTHIERSPTKSCP